MKRVHDPKLRQIKIQQIAKIYFSKEGGVGVDGGVITEIMNMPIEQISAPILLSAQAYVMKVLEDKWGEQYLATFSSGK
jgi:hypothetical protein